jgi:Coenzyme PQQ synthesis protein D (PqqD)/Prealbumin-like fold domain
MASVELEIVRSGSSEFIVQTLPDGSTAIFEVATKNVYSLNPSAAAAWEACASAITLSRLAAEMSRRLNKPVTEDLAHEAVSELVAVGLVSATPAERLGTSRRAMLKQVAGVALPVVLVLTGAEQRAHAQVTSNPIAPTTPGPGTTSPGVIGTTRPPIDFEIDKSRGPADFSVRTALAGVTFDLIDSQGHVIHMPPTDSAGHTHVLVSPGVYTLIETFAPLGPYVALVNMTITIPDIDPFGMDFHNVPVTTTGS